MTQIAAASFFALVLFAAGAVIHLTVREYWRDILCALRGDVPMRSQARPWMAPRVRVTSRPRLVAVRAMPLRRAAS